MLGVKLGTITLSAGQQKTLNELGFAGHFIRLSYGEAMCSFGTSGSYQVSFGESGGVFTGTDTSNKVCIIDSDTAAYIINKKSTSITINYQII